MQNKNDFDISEATEEIPQECRECKYFNECYEVHPEDDSCGCEDCECCDDSCLDYNADLTPAPQLSEGIALLISGKAPIIGSNNVEEAEEYAEMLAEAHQTEVTMLQFTVLGKFTYKPATVERS